MDETDRRFIGVLMFLGAIAVIASFQTKVGTASGIVLWIVSLLWMAQARPQREESHEAYRKSKTPLDGSYRGSLVHKRRRKRTG
jgi:type IV secretory pathway TrbD component